jgi:hypothetical protein
MFNPSHKQTNKLDLFLPAEKKLRDGSWYLSWLIYFLTRMLCHQDSSKFGYPALFSKALAPWAGKVLDWRIDLSFVSVGIFLVLNPLDRTHSS